MSIYVFEYLRLLIIMSKLTTNCIQEGKCIIYCKLEIVSASELREGGVLTLPSVALNTFILYSFKIPPLS